MENHVTEHVQQSTSKGKISLPHADGITFVELQTILYLKAEGNYTRVYLKNNQRVLAAKCLFEFEEKLKHTHFIRTHRSFLVNLQWITKYIKGRGGYVILEDGSAVEVSSRKRMSFLKALDKHFC